MFTSFEGELLAEGSDPLSAAIALARALKETDRLGPRYRIGLRESLGDRAMTVLRRGGVTFTASFFFDPPPRLPPGILPLPSFISWEHYLTNTRDPTDGGGAVR